MNIKNEENNDDENKPFKKILHYDDAEVRNEIILFQLLYS